MAACGGRGNDFLCVCMRETELGLVAKEGGTRGGGGAGQREGIKRRGGPRGVVGTADLTWEGKGRAPTRARRQVRAEGGRRAGG